MTSDVLSPLQSDELLADRAYRELSQAIVSRGLEPGTRLSVPELARQLGVSRSPVREAVQRLIYDGLAEDRGRRGAVVARIEPDDFLSLLELRELLEGFAAGRAALHATDEDIARLRGLVERHRNDIGQSEMDDVAHVEYDLEFHSAIRDAAKNEDLTMALARMQVRSHLSYATLWRQPRRAEHALAEHEAIVDAVAASDLDAAEAAARAHIGAVRDRYVASLQEDGTRS